MKAKSAQQHKAVATQSGQGHRRRGRDKGSVPQERLFSHNPIAAAVSGLLMVGGMGHAYGLPTGADIVAGDASISSPDSGSMQIDQSGSSLIVNWQSFGIDAGEQVNFSQPSSDAVALNRVVGDDPSLILGQLNSNGRIFLVNQNGVLFGSSAKVDVGALVASSLDISDADFLAGNYNFGGDGSQGSVVNQGDITVAPGGFAALIGSQAINEGVIAARLGSVVLAAGDKVSMALDDTGLINLSVDKGSVDALASNSGLLKADGGLVLMSARSAGDLLSTVINNEGVIEAHSLVESGGVIRLEASDAVANTGEIGQEANAGQVTNAAGMVVSSGTLDTSAAETNAQRGAITISGSRVGVSGDLLARGAEGSQGGSILINASEKSVVTAGSVLDASGMVDSSAGSVVVWSDDTTQFSGSITATGGALSGDGGTAEVSGLQSLLMQSTSVNTRAANGAAGTLLLDPTDITIIDQSDGAGTLDAGLVDTAGLADVLLADGDIPPNTLSETTLETLAAGTVIKLEASGTIAIENLADNVLDLSNAASVSFTAGGGITYYDTLNDRILTNGANVVMTAGDVAQLGGIVTNGGTVNITSTNAALIYGAIDTKTTVVGRNDGPITLSSNALRIINNVDAGRSNVTLVVDVAGNATQAPPVSDVFYLGTVAGDDSGIAAGNAHHKLDSAELSYIKTTAGLIIEAGAASEVLVGSLLAQNKNITINSGGNISQEAGGTGIAMGSAGNYTLTLNSNANNIGTSANPVLYSLGTLGSQINATSTSGDIYLTKTSGNLSSSQTKLATGAGAQTIEVTAQAGSVIIDSALNLGDDNVTLRSAGIPNLLNINSGSLQGDGNLTLIADLAYVNGAIDTGTGSLVIRPNNAAQPIQVGLGASDVGVMGLSDAELARITAGGGLTIGGTTQTGNVSLVGAATTASGTNLTLTTGGAIDGSGVISSTGGLSLNAGTGIGDINAATPVNVGSVTGSLSANNTTSGDMYLATQTGVTLGGTGAAITQYPTGAIQVDSQGSITVGGAISAGSIALNTLNPADGQILGNADSNLNAATVTLTSAQGIGDTTTALKTQADTLNLTSNAGLVNVANTGNVNLTGNATGGSLTVSSAADAVAGDTGAMTLAGPSSSSDAISLTTTGLFTNSPTASLTTTDGVANSITINADKMSLGAAIGDAADTVYLTSGSTGSTIELGVADDANAKAGTLELSNTELGLVNGSLVIGDTASSGDISLVGAVNRPGALTLRSSGTISDTATGVLSAPVSSLVAIADKGINLANNTHSVPTVDLTVVSSGDIAYNSSVGTGNSLNLTANNTGPGAIGVTESTGLLNVAGVTSAGGNVTYRANDITLAGGSTNAGSGNVTLTTATAANSIALGAKDATADPTTLDISSAELDTITTTGTLTIGDSLQEGGIRVVADTSALNSANLTLTTGKGAITHAAGVVSSTGTLSLNAANGIGAAGSELQTSAATVLFDNTATNGVYLADQRTGQTTLVSGTNAATDGMTAISSTGSLDTVATTGVVKSAQVSLSAAGADGIGATNGMVLDTNTLSATASAGNLIVNNTNTGTLSTGGALSALAGKIDLTTAGGLTINHDVTARDTIGLSAAAASTLTHSAGRIDSTNDATITLTADKMTLGGSASALIGDADATDSTILQSTTAANGIKLGSSGESIDAIDLDAAEINSVLGALTLKSADGTITVTGDLARTSAGDLTLTTNGAGTVDAPAIGINAALSVQPANNINLSAATGAIAGAGVLTGKGLSATANTGISLTGANQSGSADLTTTSGDIAYNSNLGAGNNLSLNATNNSAGAINVHEQSGGLVIAAGNGVSTAGGSITLKADDMEFQAATDVAAAATVNAGSAGAVTLDSGTVGRVIDLGVNSATDAGTTLELTDAELDLVTAGTLTIGSSAHAAPINVAAAIDPLNADNLSITNGAAILGAGGSLSVTGGVAAATNNLLLIAKGGIGALAGPDGVPAEAPVEIATVDGVLGVSNSVSGDVFLKTGAITLGSESPTVIKLEQNAANAELRIDATGSMEIAGELSAAGDGTITLNSTNSIGMKPGTTGRITATNVNLGLNGTAPSSIGASVSAPLLTSAANLNARGGAVYLDNNKAVKLIGMQASSGDAMLNNSENITVAGNVTAAGTVSLTAGGVDDATDPANVIDNSRMITHSSGLINAPTITLAADYVSLANGAGAVVGAADGSSNIAIHSTNADNAMVLGSPDDNHLALSDEEINSIVGNLTLGGVGMTGTISTAGAVTRTTAGDLTLITAAADPATGAAISLDHAIALGDTQTLTVQAVNGSIAGGVNGALTAAQLNAVASQGINLQGPSNIASVHLENTAAGDVSYTGNTTGGVTLDGFNRAADGRFSVNEQAGSVTVANTGIQTNSGEVSLATGAGGTLTLNSGVSTRVAADGASVVLGASVTLTADDMAINSTVSANNSDPAAPSTVTLGTASGTNRIVIGSESSDSLALSLTQAELDNIRNANGKLLIGGAGQTGGIIVDTLDDTPVSVQTVNSLTLENSVGGIQLSDALSAKNGLALIANSTGADSGSIQGPGTLSLTGTNGTLSLMAATGIGSLPDNAINIGSLGTNGSLSATNTTSGDLFLNTAAITLGGAGAVLSQAEGGTLRVDASGPITIGDNVFVGADGTTGRIILNAVGSITGSGTLGAATVDLGQDGTTTSIGSAVNPLNTKASDINAIVSPDATGGITIANTGDLLLNASAPGAVSITTTGSLTTDTGGVVSTSADVALKSGGAMNIGHGVSGPLGINLSAAGMLTHTAGIIDAAGKDIQLTASQMDLVAGDAGSIGNNHQTTTVTLSHADAVNGPIEIGSADSNSKIGVIEISSAELNSITAGTVIIGGDTQQGSISVVGPTDVTSINNLHLRNNTGGIAVNDTLTSAGNLTLTANYDAANPAVGSAVGAITADPSKGLLEAVSGNLTLSAATGIGTIPGGAVRVGTVAGTLSANNTTSGDIFLATSDITLGTSSTLLTGAADSELRIDASGDIMLAADGVTVADGAAQTSTITLNASGTISGPGTLTASSVNIGNTFVDGAKPSSVGTQAEPLNLSSAALNLNSTGDLFATNDKVATLAMNVSAGTGTLTNNGDLTLAGNVYGADGVALTVTQANGWLAQNANVTVGSNSGSIILTADEMALGGVAGSVGGAGDSVTLKALTPGREINLGGATDIDPTILELSQDELRTVGASTLTIETSGALKVVGDTNLSSSVNTALNLISTGSDITLSKGLTTFADLTLDAQGGAIIRSPQSLGMLSSTQGNLSLNAANGIGSISPDGTTDSPIMIGAVGGNLSAHNGTEGDINLKTNGPITLGGGPDVTLVLENTTGELRVVAGGDMILAGDLMVGSGSTGTITLDATGSISEQSVAASTLRAATVNLGTVNAPVTVTTLGADGMPILSLASTAMNVKSSGDAYLGNSANLASFTANNGGLLQMVNTGSLKTGAVTAATVDISTQGGSGSTLEVAGNMSGTDGVTLTTAPDALFIHSAGSAMTSDQSVTLTADSARLVTGTSITAPSITIAPNVHDTAPVDIDLGSLVDTTTNQLALSDGELKTLHGNVTIGGATAGNITISESIATAADVGSLSLISGGAGDQGIAVNNNLTMGSLTGALVMDAGEGAISSSVITGGTLMPVLTASALTANAGTGIALTGANQVGQVSLTNSTSGAVAYTSGIAALDISGSNVTDGDGFTVSSEGATTVNPLGIGAAGQNISITSAGLLTIDGAVNAASDGGTPTISLSADDMALNAIVDAGAQGGIVVSTKTAGTGIDLGGSTNTAGLLALNQADVDQLRAATLTLNAGSGSIQIDGAVLPENITDLVTLSTTAAITNSIHGSIGSKGSLRLLAAQGIGDIATNAPVVISSLGETGQLSAVNRAVAPAVTSGDVYLHSLSDIAIGYNSDTAIIQKSLNGVVRVEADGNLELAGGFTVDNGLTSIHLDADKDGDGVGGAISRQSGTDAVLTASNVTIGVNGVVDVVTLAPLPTTTTVGSADARIQTNTGNLIVHSTGSSYLTNSAADPTTTPDLAFAAYSTGGMVDLEQQGTLTSAAAGVNADQVLLKATDMVLTGGTIGRTATSSVNLTTIDPANSIALGVVDDFTNTTLELASAEIDTVLGQLTVGGSSQQGAITVPGNVARTAGNGGVTLQTADAVSGSGKMAFDTLTVNAGTGITLGGDNDSATVDLNSVTGNIDYTSSLTALAPLTLTGSGAADITITEKAATLAIGSAGLATTAGNVTLKANEMDIQGALKAAGDSANNQGILTLTPNNSGNGFILAGSTTSIDQVELSAAELGLMRASVLRIGDNTQANRISGTIQVDGAIDLVGANSLQPNVAALHLSTTAGITGTGSVKVSGLALESGSNVSLTGQNSVETIAADVSNALAFTNNGALSVGTVDGVTGLTTSIPGSDILLTTVGGLSQAAPITSAGGLGIVASGPVDLTGAGNSVADKVAGTVTGTGNGFALTTTGDLAVGSVATLDGITTAAGDVALNTPSKLSVDGTKGVDATGANVSYGAADFALVAPTKAAGVVVTPTTAGDISLGGAGALLSATELDTLTANTLTVDGSGASGITLTGAADLTGDVGKLNLVSGGTISQLTDAALTVPELEVTAPNGDVDLHQAANNVGKLTATVGYDTAGVKQSTSDLAMRNAGPLDLGPIKVSGDVKLSTGGDLTDTGAVQVDGATTLDTAGADVVLDNIANNFGGLVSVSNADDVTLADSDGLDLALDNVSGLLSLGTDANPIGGPVNVTDTGDLDIDKVHSEGKVDLRTDGTLTMVGVDSVINNKHSPNKDDIWLTATGDANLGELLTNGDVYVTAGGSILDVNDADGTVRNNISAVNATLTALTGSVGTFLDAIEVDLTGALLVQAGGHDGSGVSVNIDGTTGDGTLHTINNPPGLVIFNGSPLFGQVECTSILGQTCEAFLAATGGNIRITLDNGDVIILPSIVRHLDGLVDLINTVSRNKPIGMDMDRLNELDAGGGLIKPSDEGSILLPEGVVMNVWQNQPTAVASLDLYQQQMAR